MPLLHITLVEVHREYEKANMVAKDMVEAYKKATSATNQLQEQYDKSQAINVFGGATERSHGNDQGLEEQLRENIKKLEETTNQATQAEQKVHKLEDRLAMAKIDLGKWMEAKDHVIQQLKRKLAQHQNVVTQQVEQMHDLEEYTQIQMEYFLDRISKSTLQTAVAHEEHQKEKERLEAINANLTKICV